MGEKILERPFLQRHLQTYDVKKKNAFLWSAALPFSERSFVLAQHVLLEDIAAKI